MKRHLPTAVKTNCRGAPRFRSVLSHPWSAQTNIRLGYAYAFESRCDDRSDLYAYAEGSIMHYSAYAFSANGQPTIRLSGALITSWAKQAVWAQPTSPLLTSCTPRELFLGPRGLHSCRRVAAPPRQSPRPSSTRSAGPTAPHRA